MVKGEGEYEVLEGGVLTIFATIEAQRNMILSTLHNKIERLTSPESRMETNGEVCPPKRI